MKATNDNFSRCVSALHRSYIRNVDGWFADPLIKYYGVGAELATHAMYAHDFNVVLILAYWGYENSEEFEAELLERTSDRFVFEHSYLTNGN